MGLLIFFGVSRTVRRALSTETVFVAVAGGAQKVAKSDFSRANRKPLDHITIILIIEIYIFCHGQKHWNE